MIMKTDPRIITKYGHEDGSTILLAIAGVCLSSDVVSGVDEIEGLKIRV
jgi:hypothetical protein